MDPIKLWCLLPSVAQATKVDLNAEYLKSPVNMFSTDEQCRFVAGISGNEVTYGGFGEERSDLLAGFEKEAEENAKAAAAAAPEVAPRQRFRMTHLGIDINNLDVGQMVCSLTDGIVFHVLDDETAMNGWGTRIITFDGDDTYCLYGHLSKTTHRAGDVIYKTDLIGRIGAPAENGGWFPHLHLQVMTSLYMEDYRGRYTSIDGYSFYQKVSDLRGIVDPETFLA